MIAADVLLEESRADLFSCFLEVIAAENGQIDHHLVPTCSFVSAAELYGLMTCRIEERLCRAEEMP